MLYISAARIQRCAFIINESTAKSNTGEHDMKRHKETKADKVAKGKKKPTSKFAAKQAKKFPKRAEEQK